MGETAVTNRHITKLNSIAIAFGIGLWFSSCNSADSDLTVRTSPTLTPEAVIASLPDYSYAMPIWDNQGELILFLSSEGWTVKYVYAESQRIQQLALPEDVRCRRTKHYVERTLPDGRLGIRELCLGRWPDRAPGVDSNEEYILAYDWASGTVEQIVDGPIHDISSDFTWNPEMERGIEVTGSLLTTLYWITPSGVEPMEIVVQHGDKQWSLAETLKIRTSTDDDVWSNKRDVGNASQPDWSPDGQMIAFVASVDAIDRSGMARSFSEYSLYLMDVTELEPYPVLDGLFDPSSAFWSPDSRWLAFSATTGQPTGDRGLWLFSPAQKLVQLISEGNFIHISWSLDGEKIVTIRCLEVICNQSEVVIYDVSSLLR